MVRTVHKLTVLGNNNNDNSGVWGHSTNEQIGKNFRNFHNFIGLWRLCLFRQPNRHDPQRHE